MAERGGKKTNEHFEKMKKEMEKKRDKAIRSSFRKIESNVSIEGNAEQQKSARIPEQKEENLICVPVVHSAKPDLHTAIEHGHLESEDKRNRPAAQLNQESESTTKGNETIAAVTFLVGSEELALTISYVQEIIEAHTLTKIPNSSRYILGFCNHREELLPIVDSRALFGLPDCESDNSKKIIVMDVNERKIGLLVDRVFEILHVEKDLIFEPPRTIKNIKHGLISGMIRASMDDKILILIDAVKVLAQLSEEAEEKNGDKLDSKAEDIQVYACNEEVISAEHIVLFRLNGTEFGINVEMIEEISALDNVVPMPGYSSYIEGIVNLRGEAIPAINLKKIFNFTDALSDCRKFIVLKYQQQKIGIIIDSATEVLKVSKDILEYNTNLLQKDNNVKYFYAIAKLNEGRRIAYLINVTEILKLL